MGVATSTHDDTWNSRGFAEPIGRLEPLNGSHAYSSRIVGMRPTLWNSSSITALTASA